MITIIVLSLLVGLITSIVFLRNRWVEQDRISLRDLIISLVMIPFGWIIGPYCVIVWLAINGDNVIVVRRKP